MWCKRVQLRNEKSELEGTLAREQEHQMQKLMKHIERLQNEVSNKQETLDQVAATHRMPSQIVLLFLFVSCDISLHFISPHNSQRRSYVLLLCFLCPRWLIAPQEAFCFWDVCASVHDHILNKVYEMLGHKLILKNSLRHLTNALPKFYYWLKSQQFGCSFSHFLHYVLPSCCSKVNWKHSCLITFLRDYIF